MCFHFQQAAEKYLKAYIVAFNLQFKKIHDLPELLRICKGHDRSFDSLEECCEFLTDFYIDSRYPVHWPAGVERKEAEKSMESAEEIKDFVEEKLITRE
jgi:HEPN domain-containing protein